MLNKNNQEMNLSRNLKKKEYILNESFQQSSGKTAENTASSESTLQELNIHKMEFLLKKLMKIVIENAGANRGYLVFEQNNELIINANFSMDKEITIKPQKLKYSKELPKSLLYYVKRTQDLVVLDESNFTRFETDPFFIMFKPKSILCMPILNKDNFIGLLYLENDLTSNVFTDERIRILQYLSSQVAISLKNAMMYQDIQESSQIINFTIEKIGKYVEISDSIDMQSEVSHLPESELIKLILNKMRKNTEDLQSILKKQKLGVLLADEQSNIYFINDYLLQFLRKKEQQLLDKKWFAALQLNSQIILKLKQMIEYSEENRPTLLVENKINNKYYHFEINIKDNPRDHTGKIIFFYNITEIYRLKTQEKLPTPFYQMIGKSEPIKKVFEQIKNIGRLDCTVLIEGDTGTGKELVARALHYESSRKDKPFIAVNCAGLTDSILSSQLFGHKKGAFTGATQDHIGFFEAADGGTIFLDEIGDISPAVQTHLLRILEEGEFYRVGETIIRNVDVRIITATNQDLSSLVQKEIFRADLLFRLKIARINLPALQERKKDIPLIAISFMEECSREIGKPIKYISTQAMQKLMEYHWPGNIRELKNCIWYAVIHSNSNGITLEDLPPEILERHSIFNEIKGNHNTMPKTKDQLIEALKIAHGNRSDAAKILGVSRVTLYNWMKKYGLK